MRSIIKRLAVWVVLSGVVVGGIVWVWHVEQRSVIEEVARSVEAVDNLAFAPNGSLSVARRQQANLTVRRFGSDGSQLGSVGYPLPKNTARVALFADGSRVAATEGTKVVVRRLFDQSAAEVEHDLKMPIMDLGVSKGGQVAVLFESGELHLLDGITLGSLGSAKLPFKSPGSLRMNGSYLAVASQDHTEAAVFDIRNTAQPRTAEYRKFDKPFLSVHLSSSGRLMAGVSTGVVIGTRTIPLPGAVRAVAPIDDGHIVAGGDFEGVYRAETNGGNSEKIAAGSGIQALDVHGSSIAAAGHNGFVMLRSRQVAAIGSTGMLLILVWAGATAIFMLVQLFGLREARLPSARAKGITLGRYQAPEGLKAAVRDGRCALFAGEDLNASAGIPRWNEFTRQLLDWIHDLNLMEEDRTDEIRGLFNNGREDEAGRRVLDAMASRPSLLTEYARGIYLAPSTPTPLHEALSRVRFNAAVTPNLDVLLERTFATADLQIRVPGETDSSNKFALTKLRGRFDHDSGVMLSPADAATDEAAQAEIEELLRTHTVLFLCSTEEELALWLDKAGAQQSAIRHYAILPDLGQPNRKFDAVARRLNIECVYYSESSRAQIPEFLKQISVAAPVTAAAS